MIAATEPSGSTLSGRQAGGPIGPELDWAAYGIRAAVVGATTEQLDDPRL